MRNDELLKKLGMECRCFRMFIHKVQIDVAVDTGYSVESISSFERGRTNNLRILLWYVNEGYDICDFVKRWNNED